MPLAANTRIGEFTVTKKLGEGAFGEVWKGKDPAVVIRIAREDAHVRALRLQSRAHARLDHPAVVRLRTADLDHDPPYAVFDFVEGESLRDLLKKEGPVSVERAIRIIRQVLDALESAHENGVVHGDLRPGNILVGPADDVYLTNFGAGELPVAGTMTYLSPEQRGGRPPTAASDLYSVGLLIHELLTGEAHRLLLPIPSVPDWVSGVVRDATNRDPNDRHKSARAMRNVLEVGDKADSGFTGTGETTADVPSVRPPPYVPPEERPPTRRRSQAPAPAKSSSQSYLLAVFGTCGVILLLVLMALASGGDAEVDATGPDAVVPVEQSRPEGWTQPPPGNTETIVCGWCNGDGEIGEADLVDEPYPTREALGTCVYCGGSGSIGPKK